MDSQPTASMNRHDDFGVKHQSLGRARSFLLQTQFRAAENIPCYVLWNINIRQKSGHTLTSLKRQVRCIIPYTAVCG